MKSVVKKLLGIGFVFVIFVSCKTIKETTNTITNEIQSQKIALNSYFDKDEYSVIGTAEGSSEFVWWSEDTELFEGDSGKYGYIYEPSSVNVGDGIFVGTGKRLTNAGAEDALRHARLNANYELIENAYSLGGDFIFEPVYSVETVTDIGGNNDIRKFKVTVRAKVIQLKNK